MLQRWESLTFLHWPYSPDVIRSALPTAFGRAGIVLDTFDGKAWVGLVPFLLTRLRPPGFPRIPWLGRFPETNVRTYVRGPDGKPAVYFFTLDADRLLAVLGARAAYGLLYRWARMSVRVTESLVEYRSVRHRPFGPGRSRLVIEPAGAMPTQKFDDFLTGRFRLYSNFANRIAYADIEHHAWSLQHARVLTLEQDLFVHSGVPQPSGEPVVHFSRTLDVHIGRPRLA